jgi:hypothetical protein
MVSSTTEAAVCRVFQDDCQTTAVGKTSAVDGKSSPRPQALNMKANENSAQEQQEKGFTVEQLLEDCQTSPVVIDEFSTMNYHGTGYLGFRDGCTFEEQGSWTDWRWEDIGTAPISNCRSQGARPYPTYGNSGIIDQTISGTKTHTQGFSIGGTPQGQGKGGYLGIDLPFSYKWEDSTSVSTSVTIHVPEGWKGNITWGTKWQHSKGRIRLNYSTPVGPKGESKHYIWYINNVQFDTPIGDKNKEFFSDKADVRSSHNYEIGQDLVPCDQKLISEMGSPYVIKPDGEVPANVEPTS